MAIREGDVIRAEVVDVQEDGIYLRHEGVNGFVNVTEMTWTPVKIVDPHEHATKGGTLEVRVYAVTPARFYASIKKVHPEDDPWRDPAAYDPGTRHRGVVQNIVPFGAFVRLERGAIGRIAPDRGGDRLRVGDVVEATVVTVDPALQKIELSVPGAAMSSTPPPT